MAYRETIAVDVVQDNFAPSGRSARMYLTNIRSSVDASGKPHRMHHMSRAGVSGDSTTTVLYSAVQHGQRNAIGAGFFIIMNRRSNVETGAALAIGRSLRRRGTIVGDPLRWPGGPIGLRR